jgi:Zn-dependent membrane protease YugP
VPLSTHAGGYWAQVAAIRAQSNRPVVRFRAATVAVAEPLVTVTIVLLLCGVVSGRALLLDLAFGVALAVVLLVAVVLVASVYARLLHSWRRVDGR